MLCVYLIFNTRFDQKSRLSIFCLILYIFYNRQGEQHRERFYDNSVSSYVKSRKKTGIIVKFEI